MSGILRLESLTKGNTLKQGDKTPLKYRLLDADGDLLSVAGKSAEVRLVYPDFLTIGYKKDGLTVAPDDTVTFTIDQAIPARIYHVEIIVDNKFVFPSRAHGSKLTVDKSSLGADTNIIEIVGKDVLIQEVKSQVDTELKPLVTSLESAQQSETQRATEESARVSAEAQRKTDHANRSAELDSKADKVVLRNLVANGDFSDGLNHWGLTSSVYGELSLRDGNLVGNGTGLSNSIRIANDSFNIISGHKYYLNIKQMVTVKPTLLYIYNGFPQIYVNNQNAEANTWYETKGIFTAIRNEIPIFRSNYADTATQATSEHIIDYAMAFDLTETFGAGNEPTKEEMDRLIEITGYIGSENGISIKEMLDYLMNDIRGKADKVVIKNLIENGDFSEGTDTVATGFQPMDSTSNPRLVDGVQYWTGSTTAYAGSLRAYPVNLNSGDIYYISTIIDNVAIVYANDFLINTGNVDGLHSSTFALASDFTNITFRVRTINEESSVSTVQLINLTQTFGAGNEPTKVEMDELIKVTGYIDGEYALNNKEMLIWSLALIRRNTSAIVALGGA